MSAVAEKRNVTNEIAQAIRKNKFDASREEALKKFEQAQLPLAKAEEYKFFPIGRILEKNFPTWPIQSAAGPTSFDVDAALPKGIDADILVVINGVWSKAHSKIKSSEIQVQVNPNQGEFTSQDSFALLNSAAAIEQLSIRIPAKTELSNPIFLLFVNHTTTQSITAQTRIAITLEEGSKASLIQRTVVTGENPVFHNGVEDILVRANAHLDYYKIQDDTGKIIQVSNTAIRQETASQVNTFTLTLDGLAIRNNLNIFIDGENCESHFHGLYLLKGDTLVDNHTVVDHLKPNSFSNEMYKGVMDDQSKGVFNGKIFVRPHAQKTNAFQSNRNILLTDQATVNTKPQLEIWADDVKCSHGCTTGQLDEEAMFYLQTRGIPKDTARAMLLYAFASEVLQIVPNTVLRDYMDQLVSERLHKNF
jgi:Fe-S cluster assembly protein SufD